MSNIKATFLLCISLFLCAAAYAQTSSSTAVVSFVGYDDKQFKEEPKHIKEVFTSQNGAFRVPQNNYITIDMQASFPDGFTSKVTEAMAKIESEKNPLLILALESHGVRGDLKRKNLSSIGYYTLFNFLLKNTLEQYPQTQVMIFLDACYSGSAIPELKDLASKYKVSIYTLSDDENSGFGRPFFSAIGYLGSKSKYRSAGVGLNPEGYYIFDKIMYAVHTVSWDKEHSTGYWSSFEQQKMLTTPSAEEVDKEIVGFAHYALKNDDESVGFFVDSRDYKKDRSYVEKLINFIKKENNIYDDKEIFKTIYKCYSTADNNKLFWFKLLTNHYVENIRKVDLGNLMPHVYDLINFMDLLTGTTESEREIYGFGYTRGPETADKVLKLLDNEKDGAYWAITSGFNKLKEERLNFVIGSIEKYTTQHTLSGLIRSLLEFDNYDVSYYADEAAYLSGVKTSLSYGKRASDALTLVMNNTALSDYIRVYAEGSLSQLEEKVMSAKDQESNIWGVDAKNVILRFMNESTATNDDVILNKFFDAIYAESVSLDGKLSPKTLSILFRDDVLYYISKTSNPDLASLAGITKDMIELEKTSGDIADFKNAKIEEFKEAYEEIRTVVKK